MRIHPACAILFSILACGGNAKSSRFPPRPVGCAVQEFTEAPTVPSHNIGRVDASCGRSVLADECRRTLKDEVCKIGGDIMWDVVSSEGEDGKTILNARAAHTKSAP